MIIYLKEYLLYNMMYKFIPQDKQYETFQVVDTNTFQQVDMFESIEMTKSKLFSNDIFNFE